jgi:hypothetical protein
LAWACTNLPGIAVYLPCLRHGSPPDALLPTTLSLLGYKVLELVHQLLRVTVAVTRWARDLVHGRVRELLYLHHLNLGGGILGDASAPGVLSSRCAAFTA